MNDSNGKANLAKKLAIILGEIGKVPKSGHNAFHRYDYVTENDLVYAVRDKLAAHSIFVFSSVESQKVTIIEDGDKKSALTEVVTKHTFVDGETGAEFSVLSQGQGADVGDKGGYKAITGAMKYFLYKCFMIPTGDDPEGDEKTDVRGAQPRNESARTPARSTEPQRSPAPSNQTPYQTPSVPRTAATVDQREQFEGGKWQSVKIHFGKQKGMNLGSLDEQSLGWWIHEWQPKPYQGAIDAEAKILRAALDAAGVETGF